jgi:LysR family transcriptional regulator, glycine cleavage system transcriptional activator
MHIAFALHRKTLFIHHSIDGMHRMALPRRYLPSLSLLSAFEAVVRTGSTQAAAHELDLSQGTVSRLVQNLEAQVGVALFLRGHGRLRPTDAARAYARDLRRAMDIIGAASLRLTAAPGGGALSLAILPTFGAHWLAPRLPDFLGRHPGVTLNLATQLRPFDFAESGHDAAIHYGQADWPGATHRKLFDEQVIALCSPAFAAAHRISGVADLLALPLLQLESRPDEWQAWFAHHACPRTPPRGMVFDQFATVMQAAIHGVGLALLPAFLAGPAVADGRLIPAFGPAVPVQGSYWLVWPASRGAPQPLPAFADWLVAACAPLRG